MPAFIAKPAWPFLWTSHPLARGLVGAWTFYEGSGKTANDQSPSDINGTFAGSTLPAWVAGSTGWWLSFNGTTAYIPLYANTPPASLPSPLSGIAAANSSYTIAARIKTTASTTLGAGVPWSTGNNIIEGRTTGAPATGMHAWAFGIEGGKLAAARNGGGSSSGQRIVSTTSVNDGVEHYVAVVVNSNSASLYIDGKLDATGTYLAGVNAAGDCSLATANGNVYVQLGARTTNAGAAGNFWSGNCDYVMIWNRGLSLAEIVQLTFDSFEMFRFGRRIPPEVFGNTTYNVSITESLSLSDTLSNVFTAVPAVAETLSLADTPSAVLDTAQSVAETLSLADTESAGSTYAVTMLESITLLETASDVLVTPQTVAEILTVSDSPSAIVTTPQTVAETVTLLDAPTAVLVSPQDVSETLTLADTLSTASTVLGSVAESLSLADTPNAAATSSQAISESLTLSDTPSAIAVWLLSVAEALSLLDALDGALTFPVDVTEALSLDDTILAALIQALGFDFIFLIRDAISVSVLHLEILESSTLKGEKLEVTSLVSETLAW